MDKIRDIIENKYLVAMNRVQETLTLGISSEPLSLLSDDAKEKRKTEYILHISGIWRLSKNGEIISSFRDFYTAVDENGDIVDDKVDFEDDTHSRQRTLLECRAEKSIFPNLPLKVIKASKKRVGDLRLELEKGFCFEAFSTYHLDDGAEEWRLVNIAKNIRYVCPDRYAVDVLLVDESNTDLSQMLEMLLNEIAINIDFNFESAGLHPGREISDRVCSTGRQRYGIDIKEIQKAAGLADVGYYDFVIPLGITLSENEAEGAKRLLMYQGYKSEAKESIEELLEMAARICKAVRCKYQIDDERRNDRKEELEMSIRIQQGVDAFFDRTKSDLS